MCQRRSAQLILWCLLTLTPALCRADLYIVVNKVNSQNSVTVDQVERIFLLKTKRFENGDSADPVNQPEGSRARNRFNTQLLRRNEQQLKYYWSRKMFSGSDKPPQALATDADVEAFVAGKPGGIGYLTVPPQNERVKTVLTVKE